MYQGVSRVKYHSSGVLFDLFRLGIYFMGYITKDLYTLLSISEPLLSQRETATG